MLDMPSLSVLKVITIASKTPTLVCRAHVPRKVVKEPRRMKKGSSIMERKHSMENLVHNNCIHATRFVASSISLCVDCTDLLHFHALIQWPNHDPNKANTLQAYSNSEFSVGSGNL